MVPRGREDGGDGQRVSMRTCERDAPARPDLTRFPRAPHLTTYQSPGPKVMGNSPGGIQRKGGRKTSLQENTESSGWWVNTCCVPNSLCPQGAPQGHLVPLLLAAPCGRWTRYLQEPKDSSWGRLCYSELSHRHLRPRAGAFAPGRCSPAPPWAAPQRGSRRGAPRVPRSREERGEPAQHHDTSSAPPRPAGPASPASSWKDTETNVTFTRGDGVAKTPTRARSHVHKADFFLPFFPPSSNTAASSPSEQGVLHPPAMPSIRTARSCLT